MTTKSTHVSITKFTNGYDVSFSESGKAKTVRSYYRVSEASMTRLSLFTWRNKVFITIHVSCEFPSMWFDHKRKYNDN